MLNFKVTNLLHFKLKNRQQKVNGFRSLIYKRFIAYAEKN